MVRAVAMRATCRLCGAYFLARRSDRHYCGAYCRNKVGRQRRAVSGVGQ